MDRILGKETLEFGIQLCCQGLVVGQYQGGTPGTGNHVRHGERFARACYAQQCLIGYTVIHAASQFGYCLRLVARRFIIAMQSILHCLIHLLQTTKIQKTFQFSVFGRHYFAAMT